MKNESEQLPALKKLLSSAKDRESRLININKELERKLNFLRENCMEGFKVKKDHFFQTYSILESKGITRETALECATREMNKSTSASDYLIAKDLVYLLTMIDPIEFEKKLKQLQDAEKRSWRVWYYTESFFDRIKLCFWVVTEKVKVYSFTEPDPFRRHST